MEIKLLETAGWYTVFKKLRESYKLDSRCKLKNSIGGSWNTIYDRIGDEEIKYSSELQINRKDLQLLSTLVKKGDSHSKIIRGLQTYVEITAPRYWWQEWITYCIGVLEINPSIDWVSLSSESTMHTLSKIKEDIDNFSKEVKPESISLWWDIFKLNEKLDTLKANLPEGYLQTRTYQVSYQAWRRIYQQRKDHRLEEWSKTMVEFIEQLPFAKELITCEYESN